MLPSLPVDSNCDPEEPESRKKPGLSRAFVLPSNDPMSYANGHDSRGEAIKLAIRKQELALEASRSKNVIGKETELVAPTAFRYDHVPIAFSQSESQTQYFPRSSSAVRTCGGGKDSRFTKPYGDYERWREAVWAQQNAMGKART
jgi:hypothetical protein